MTTTTRVERLRATLDSVRQHGHEHFAMESWFSRLDAPDWYADVDEAPEVDLGKCGTTGCLAGHASVAAWRLEQRRFDYSKQIADWLGIDSRLFDPIEGHPQACTARDQLGQWEWAIELLEQEIKHEEDR